MSDNPNTPKTREEFEAYCRAMDEANEAIINSATEQVAADQQARQPAQPVVEIDDDAEDWVTLMMGITAAKENPRLRREFEEKLSPEVLRAADECSSYEDFKQQLERYQTEGLPNA